MLHDNVFCCGKWIHGQCFPTPDSSGQFDNRVSTGRHPYRHQPKDSNVGEGSAEQARGLDIEMSPVSTVIATNWDDLEKIGHDTFHVELGGCARGTSRLERLKEICGIPPPASLGIVSVRSEVSSQGMLKYSCEEGHTVTGLVGRSGVFERRRESSGDHEHQVLWSKGGVEKSPSHHVHIARICPL